MSSSLLEAQYGDILTTTASDIIESTVSRSSRSVYIYDLALEHGFGTISKTSNNIGSAQIIDMQTREGAGLAIVGRLSEGTSIEGTHSPFILSAFTTPPGLAQMMPALANLPSPTTSNRLVIQVPAVSALEPTLALSPSLVSLATMLPIVPNNLAIILSEGAQEAADLAAAAYTITTSHVAHIFDYLGSGRELRNLSYPALFVNDGSKQSTVTPSKALRAAGYPLFEYYGSENPSDVFVVANGALASSVKSSLGSDEITGVVTVRLLRPWDDAKFHAALPESTKRVHVLDDATSLYAEGPLYGDVLSSVLENPAGVPPLVRSVRVTPQALKEYLESPASLRKALSISVPSLLVKTPSATVGIKKLLFVGSSGSTLDALPERLAVPFLSTKSIHTRLLTTWDIFAKPGGISLSRLVLTPASDEHDIEQSIDSLIPIGGDVSRASSGSSILVDFISILESSLLKSHEILSYAQFGAPVLVYTSWSADELIANLPSNAKSTIMERSLNVYACDPKGIIPGASDEVQIALAHIAFLRLYVGGDTSLDVLIRIARALLGSNIDGKPIEEIVHAGYDVLHPVFVPEPVVNGHTSKATSAVTEEPPLLSIGFNMISPTAFAERLARSDQNAPVAGAWHEAAKHLLFPEAYAPMTMSSPSNPLPSLLALRPELPIETYLVTCAVNRRLTPHTYNRNVFHMEFDTKGTGLTYKLGEALGVHGWNHEKDVMDFCDWYGADPNALISVPLPVTQGGSRRTPHKVTRTVFQALQQQVDIFGRPPKSFFAALATYAKDRRERMALLFIAAPEGASMLKKLGEKDTVSYVDVLSLYPSARPSIEELAVLVGEIKERHYSIASAQSVVGDRVDLLVVTVDWVTPSGTPKYGQCTRYLADLKPGQKVTVSIKPSVMKLPPSDLQPIIMAGLGTGAAPFRAFIQHRYLLKQQGTPVGPLVYYFGSRHRSQEYLYGEEIEAYIQDGIVTHAGLAFSRDSDSKVYIQHRMRQDGRYLAGLLGDLSGEVTKKGVFYLCGPTWPVPDVFETLVDSLSKYAGHTKEGAAKYIESLKEEERYVLEVY